MKGKGVGQTAVVEYGGAIWLQVLGYMGCAWGCGGHCVGADVNSQPGNPSYDSTESAYKYLNQFPS